MSDLETIWKKWKKAEDPGEQETYLSSFLEESKPTINSALTSYAGGHDDPTLNLAAKKAAVDAFKSYDESKGAALSTHLQNTLQKLTNTVKKRSQSLYAPRIVEANLRLYREADEDLRKEFGRSPSTGEIADEIGLSQKRIAQLKRFNRQDLPDSVLRDHDISEVLGAPDRDKPTGMWGEAVYSELNGRDQAIFDKVLGAHGEEKMAKGDIAKELGISNARVSQIINRILSKLQEGMDIE